MKMKRLGLVLQGGGALGAFECGVIKALNKHYPDFDCLHVVSGISSGAINAAVLVGARKGPIETLEELWMERFSVPDLPLVPQEWQPLYWLSGTPGMSTINPTILTTPWMANSVYDTAPLRQTLEELVDINKINQSSLHLVVAAVNIETGELTWFENQFKNQQKEPRPFSYDMILASGSLPPSFPMTRVTDQRTDKEGWYWDAGYSYNLPLSEVINLLERSEKGDPHLVEREVIIVELFPMQAKVPKNLFEVQNRLIQMTFSSKLQLDQKFFGKIDGYVKLMSLIKKHLKDLPDDVRQQIHEDPILSQAYKDLTGHKIITPIVITLHRSESLMGAADFSRTTIKDRIEWGYQETCAELKRRNFM